MDFPNRILYFFWRLTSAAEHALEDTYTGRLLAGVWELLSQLWYYVLSAVAIAAIFSLLFSKGRLIGFLGRKRKSAVPLACLLGLISPLPTFAAIPLAAALFHTGVSLAPLLAFVVASPVMNPSLFVLTAGAMGMRMALARTISAFLLGLSAGVLTSYLEKKNILKLSRAGSKEQEQNPLANSPDGAEGSSERSNTWLQIRLFGKEFWGLFRFIGKFFLLGIFIAAAVQTIIPSGWIISLLGRYSRFAVLIAAGLGVPLYTCGGGSIPVIEVLMRMGMSPGAALAFFISGPATKFSTLFTMYAAFNGRTVAFYLLIALVGAILLGYVYPLFG